MRKDYLPNTNIDIFQDEEMFRMNTDTRLLGNFIKVEPNDKILDIGTNNGALLLYASQYEYGKLIGVDIQEEACKLAKFNLEHNKIKDYEIICSDIKNLNLEPVEVIVCNPPYFKTSSSGNFNESKALMIARHEVYLSLELLMEKVASLLAKNGRFYLVHRASRLSEIIFYARKSNLFITKIKFIFDEDKELATAILLEIKKENQELKIIKEEFVNR